MAKKDLFDKDLENTELHIVIDAKETDKIKFMMNGDRISLCHAIAQIMRNNQQFSDVIKASVEINNEMAKESGKG